MDIEKEVSAPAYCQRRQKGMFSGSWYRDPPIYDIYGGGVTELQVCVNDQTHQLLINKPIAVCTQGSSASLPNETYIANPSPPHQTRAPTNHV